MTDLRAKFINGAVWVTSLRWAIKFLGLINTAILARLLAPDDFGLMAMAMLGVAFVEVWFGFGVETALIQNKDATRDDFDTAWTVRIIQGTCVALILVAASPLIADYFHEPRLPPLLWLIAGAIALFSASNIGIVNFQKELNFKKEFIFSVSGKVTGVIFTIALAYWLRSYWALALGIFFGYSFGFILSYVMHPYRPHLTLKKIRNLWAFSQWMLFTNMGVFVNRKADELIVGNLAPASALGLYSVSLDIGQTLTSELAQPINRVMFPLLSKIQDESARLRAIYLKITASVNTLTLPAGVGLALCAPYVVALLLGEKWLGAIPYLQIFALYGSLRFSYSGVNSLLISIGRVRSVTALEWTEACMLISFCILGGHFFGLLGIAFGRLLVALGMSVVAISYVTRHIEVTLLDFIYHLWRPIVSVVVMAGSLMLIPAAILTTPSIALFMHILIGFIVYTATLLLLWHRAGRPDGIEEIAVLAWQRALNKITS